MKTSTISLEGYQYHYAIKHGNKLLPTLFFINGAFQNMHSWDSLISNLQTDRTVVIADLPGWGQADLLPAETDFEFYAQAINEILVKETITAITSISTSYGTLIATKFAEMYSYKVDRLILTAPILKINEALLFYYPKMKSLINDGAMEKLCRFLLDVGLINESEGRKGSIKNYALIATCFQKQIRRLNTHQLECFLQNTERIIKYGKTELRQIKNIPTLVFTGEHDSFTTPTESLDIACSFRNFSFETISEADHFFLFERPEEAARLINKFVMKEGELSTAREEVLL